MDKATLRWKQIEKFLGTHKFIMNADVRVLCGISSATASRILANLAADSKLIKHHHVGHWSYNRPYPTAHKARLYVRIDGSNTPSTSITTTHSAAKISSKMARTATAKPLRKIP